MANLLHNKHRNEHRQVETQIMRWIERQLKEKVADVSIVKTNISNI